MAPPSQPAPFATKALAACVKAFKEGKEAPKLEEYKLTSLLLPNDSDLWKDVDSTFELEKLDKDVASSQFGETLPSLTTQLINDEAEAKRKLAPPADLPHFVGDEDASRSGQTLK